MFYYVYVLYSDTYNRLYIGYTSNLRRRFQEHNQGKSKATKPFSPYKLIFYEAFTDRKDAKDREVYLKSGWGRRSLKKMLVSFYKSHPHLDQAVNILEATNYPFLLRQQILEV